MTLRQRRAKTIAILLIIFILSCYLVFAAKDVQIRKEAEFRSRAVLWQERNIEVENEIKGYIDDIDWGYYIEQFADALMNPALTAKDLYEYYGGK